MKDIAEKHARKHHRWVRLTTLARTLAAVVLGGHVVFANAQTTETLAQRIPGVMTLSSDEVRVDDQLVPLGSVKEGRDGRATPESSKRVAGLMRKSVFQLPSELALDSARKSLESGWLEQHPGSRALYRCAGRECGQSNLWANEVFSESLLFGNDRTQFAFAFLDEAARNVALIYGSERPNKRSHFVVLTVALDAPWQLDLPVSEAVESDRWALSISRTVKGQVDMRRLPVLLNPVTSSLSKRQTTHWAVIAHECEEFAAPEAFQRSQQLLDAVLPLLQKVPGKQFHAVNAGNAINTPCATSRNLEVIELRP